MRVLVTGATGFLGRSLVPRLVAHGHEVLALARDLGRVTPALRSAGVDWVPGDVTLPETLAPLVGRFDAVVHLAALRGHDPPSPEAFARFRAVNVEGTRHVLALCRGQGVEKFVFVSSTAAMGLIPDVVVDEQTPCRPNTPYQVTKLEAEALVRRAAREEGLPACIVRPSRIYGPGFKDDIVTIGRLARTGFFPKIGRREGLSPALFVSDAVEALALALERGRTGETYIVSSLREYPMLDLAGIIARELGRDLRVVPVPRTLAIGAAWAVERAFGALGRHAPITARNVRSSSSDRRFDTRKAVRELGFREEVDIAHGLALAVADYRRAGWL